MSTLSASDVQHHLSTIESLLFDSTPSLPQSCRALAYATKCNINVVKCILSVIAGDKHHQNKLNVTYCLSGQHTGSPQHRIQLLTLRNDSECRAKLEAEWQRWNASVTGCHIYALQYVGDAKVKDESSGGTTVDSDYYSTMHAADTTQQMQLYDDGKLMSSNAFRSGQHTAITNAAMKRSMMDFTPQSTAGAAKPAAAAKAAAKPTAATTTTAASGATTSTAAAPAKPTATKTAPTKSNFFAPAASTSANAAAPSTKPTPSKAASPASKPKASITSMFSKQIETKKAHSPPAAKQQSSKPAASAEAEENLSALDAAVAELDAEDEDEADSQQPKKAERFRMQMNDNDDDAGDDASSKPTKGGKATKAKPKKSTKAKSSKSASTKSKKRKKIADDDDPTELLKSSEEEPSDDDEAVDRRVDDMDEDDEAAATNGGAEPYSDVVRDFDDGSKCGIESFVQSGVNMAANSNPVRTRRVEKTYQNDKGYFVTEWVEEPIEPDPSEVQALAENKENNTTNDLATTNTTKPAVKQEKTDFSNSKSAKSETPAAKKQKKSGSPTTTGASKAKPTAAGSGGGTEKKAAPAQPKGIASFFGGKPKS